jgi:UDP-N-acetylglucosamine 2-epimerase (non-hydrolysing)
MAVKILCVAGARPNFIKIGPLMRALRQDPLFAPVLVHTGQHYDDKLSRVFFEELEIPRPDVDLEVGSGSHARQTADIMIGFEPVLHAEKPQAVLVVGDVNSTIACTLVAAKFHLDQAFATRAGSRTRPVIIHVEAGLRSFDADMPEELNRVLTDRLSDLLFVSEPAGLDNLSQEGCPPERVHFVGNVMIDSLLAARDRAMRSDILTQVGVVKRQYALLTLHRPSNVDDPEALIDRLTTLEEIARDFPIVFPVHPRTRARLMSLPLTLDPQRWKLTDPVGYLDFVKLMAEARIVLSDSGGIQEETTILGVPCLTLRENTERPVTIREGTNVLAGTSRQSILDAYRQAQTMETKGRVPRFWDGKTAGRIVRVLHDHFQS